MPVIGEKPGKGTYVCRICGFKVEVKDDDEELDLCPICEGGQYDKE